MTHDDEVKRMVKEAYDDIAPHFAETRGSVWPPTIDFIDNIAPCVLGDLGCGTGRALIHAASMDCSVVGIDVSSGQLEISRDLVDKSGHGKKVELIIGDLEELPVENDRFDACIMIAALHHLPNRKDRVKALNEACRCTKPGGRIQISVWTWDQDRFRKLHLSRENGDREMDAFDGPSPGDFMVPWKKGTHRNRFYHLYGPGELEDEIGSSDWTLLRSYFDGRNHWAECIKVP